MADSAAAIMQGRERDEGRTWCPIRSGSKPSSNATIGETERLILMLAAGGFLLGAVWRCCSAGAFPGR